jgi:hypothetical protein
MGICFSTNLWIGIVGDIAIHLYLLRYRLAADRYIDLLETVLPRLLEDAPVAVSQIVASARWSYRTAMGQISGRRGRLHGLMVAGSNCDGFSPQVTPVGSHLYSPGLVAGRQAAVKTADANMSFRVREQAMLRAAVCLEMDGCHFEHLL